VICSTYGDAAAIADGTLCAVKTNGTVPRRSAGMPFFNAAPTLSATASMNCGWSCHSPAMSISGAPATRARAAATSAT
jgi:hypothetical protein